MEEAIITSNKKINSDSFNYRYHKLFDSYTRSKGNADFFNNKIRGLQFEWVNNEKAPAKITEPVEQKSDDVYSDEEITSTPNESEVISAEDSQSLVNNIFRGRDFITSESWDSNEIIKSRIISSDDEFVYLDCIIDIDTMIIEQRQFPKALFSDFKNLNTGEFALIKIKSRPGAFRIDIYSGKGIINKSLFDINEDIQELRGRDLGTKLTEW